MTSGKLAHLIAAVAIVAIRCERAPGESARSSASVDASATSSTPTAVVAQGSFAYVDPSGAQLLALDSLPDPSAIIGALCSGGIALPVRYDRRQARQPNDNGRQVASNFRNDQGDVFRVMRGNAPPDKTCYLSRDSALLANARAITVREPSDCSPAYAARVATAKRRQMIHCWHIATTPAHREVLAVQFANVDTNALASLVVVGDSSLVFKDFPAVHSDESTWRVDDGGVFSPKDFDILFVAEMPYGYVMAIAWAGAEGESCELLIADSPGVFRTLITGYRYWAPT
jgi:hypothetical protein